MNSRLENSRLVNDQMVNDPLASSRLDLYLEEVSQHVSASQREEWREEARQHLDALIVAHQELGLSHREAVEAALISFGAAKAIGERLEKESGGLLRRTLPGCLFRPLPALAQGAFRFGLPILPGFLAMGVAGGVFAFTGGDELLTGMARVSAFLLVASPILGGWNVGRRASASHLVRDLSLTPLLGALATLPNAVVFSVLNHGTRPYPVDLVLWLTLGVASAWATHLWRQQRPYALAKP